jgi:hypothetical protein
MKHGHQIGDTQMSTGGGRDSTPESKGHQTAWEITITAGNIDGGITIQGATLLWR